MTTHFSECLNPETSQAIKTKVRLETMPESSPTVEKQYKQLKGDVHVKQ